MTSADSGLSPRARIALPLTILALVAFSVHRLYFARPAGPATPQALQRGALPRIQGRALGTTYSVTIAEDDLSPEAVERAGGAVKRALERVDALMSTWRDDSEIVRLSRHASLDPFPLSAETLEVLELAREVSVGSRGAFDVTVAPLVSAWGFGAGAAPDAVDHPPDDAQLAALAEHVGYEKLVLDPEAGVATKLHPELEVDLSAIAKGYAVDRIAAALAELGHARVLVEVGGEVVARGRKPDGSAWRVAIEEPDADVAGAGARTVERVVELTDRALATSGDYRDFYERDGRRLSHTIDPRTRRPIEHGLASVSVVHDTAALADGWATALDVLGPDEGFALAQHVGMAAYFIVRREGAAGFDVRWTDAFEPYLVP